MDAYAQNFVSSLESTVFGLSGEGDTGLILMGFKRFAEKDPNAMMEAHGIFNRAAASEDNLVSILGNLGVAAYMDHSGGYDLLPDYADAAIKQMGDPLDFPILYASACYFKAVAGIRGKYNDSKALKHSRFYLIQAILNDPNVDNYYELYCKTVIASKVHVPIEEIDHSEITKKVKDLFRENVFEDDVTYKAQLRIIIGNIDDYITAWAQKAYNQHQEETIKKIQGKETKNISDEDKEIRL